MGAVALLLAAFLWGTAFVAQKLGGNHIGPFALTFARNAVAALFLYIICAVRGKAKSAFTRRTFLSGLACGIALFFASLSQQIGIADTTPGISAFLTSNYILLVPVFGIFANRKPGLDAFVWVVLALAGAYLICIGEGEGFSIGRGEAWTLLCAALFAIQILLVDRFAPGTDIFAFSCAQQLAGAFCASPFLFLASERAFYVPEELLSAILPILYIAIFSSGIAYTCQNYGQTRCPPMLAAIIMALESAIGAVSGWLFLGDSLTTRQLAGCGILLFTVIASQTIGKGSRLAQSDAPGAGRTEEG